MFRRVFVVAVIVTIGSTASSQTQNSTGSRNKSNTPQGTSPSQPTPNQGLDAERKDGIWYIGPKKPNPPKKKPPKDSWLITPPGGLSAIRVAGLDAASHPMLYRLADRQTNGRILLATTDVSGLGPLKLPPAAKPQPSAESIIVAQERVKGPADNSYIVQFRSNVTPKQRDALLNSLGLAIKRELPNRVYMVYRTSVPADEPPPQTLSDLYNPPIVKALRRASIVENATIDSTTAPRAIPKSGGTKVKDIGGFTHQWDWTYRPTPAAHPGDLDASAPPSVLDGNWGHKYIRIPPVWTIIQNYRAAKPKAFKPKLAIIDTGFFKHEDLAINILPSPNLDRTTNSDATVATLSESNSCGAAHGNHVAGIAGAIYGNGIGIDGVIPDAKIDAVPVVDDSIDADAASSTPDERLQRLVKQVTVKGALYSDVRTATETYVNVERSKNDELRVVNLSISLNVWQLVRLNFGIEEIKEAIQPTIVSNAQMLVSTLRPYEKTVLFVIAAGNDSESLPTPLEAKWSSPLAWLATGEVDALYKNKRPKNILVVEATDRTGQRAHLSNIGGHIAAPGIDVLSTLGGDETLYGVCGGTSMAAPYAAAVATLMLELSPDKTPAEIIDIMVKSAKPKAQGSAGAPRLDALEAVLRLSPYADSRNENLVRLVDLNGDGKVDIEDMKEYARRLQILSDNRDNGTTFAADLNGDTVIDANECNWPVIDFNGSGTATLSNRDARRVLGENRNDLAVMQLAWTDKIKDSATAIREVGLDAAILAADRIGPPASPRACR